ncbi:MAG: competence protein ComEC [Microbacterium sp.]|uniref:Competence protein ComEC n=1 Tax=Microbacterium ginsengisoli TaxID=400772 RepID=A0A3C1KGU6_9MICO|nr:ComEC/Rec2 family competence protein [uncultured Microbacterium sp.]MAL07246.1 competence protein ComEC [Microbacterium sp.]HAN25907.1 competence protein ComEC [Microbacterium ginsengisoli]
MGAYRLVPVAGLTWAAAGIALFGGASIVAAIGAAVALGAIVTLCCARRASGRARAALVVAVLAACGAGAAASAVVFSIPAREQVRDALIDSRAESVSVRVVGKVEPRAQGSAFDAQVVSVDSQSGVRPGSAVPVVVLARGGVSAGTEVGAVVRVEASAFATDAGDRAVAVLTADAPPDIEQPAAGVLAGVATLRRALAHATVGLPGPAAGLIPGLAIGDTALVDDTLDAQMKTASLTHLTAVSGANCAIVVALGFAAAAALGARRRMRVAVGLTLLVGFITLTTPEPSVVRAGAMAAIAMIAVLTGRTATGIGVWSLALTVLLVLDPWLATSIGFALSAAATAALLVLARPLAAGLGRVMPRALALGIAVPLSAQLVCAPLIVVLTPTVPIYGVVANLIAAPAAPVATIVGLVATLAAPLPVLQQGLVAVAWLPAAWIAETARLFAALPFATAPWPGGPLGIVALALVGAATLGLLAPLPRRRLRTVTRAASVLVVSVTAGTTIAATVLLPVVSRGTMPPDWSIAMCDIGQGDAVLVRSASEVALIDTGDDPELLSGCLHRAGIDRIDLLVLTHFDRDHVGAAPALNGRVDTVMHGPTTERRETDIVRALGAVRTVVAHAGMSGTLGDARWRVLWPTATAGEFAEGNDGSVVVEIGGGAVPPAIFLGDLGATAQRALLRSGGMSSGLQVVKVSHHGSGDQDPGLYRRIGAVIGLVSVGAGNSYGHPRDTALALLAAAGTTVVRTDTDGMAAVSEVDGRLVVWHAGTRDVDGPR